MVETTQTLKLAASAGRWGRVLRALSLGVITPLALSGCGIAPTVTTEAGVSPFISFVHLRGFDLSEMTGVQYTIAPKPGSVSKPVNVAYSISALTARGYVSSGSLTVPVFGLYAGYENQVSVRLESTTDNPTLLKVTIPTAAYVDASGIYSRPNIVTARAAVTTLGFDFIYIKSGLGSPVIIDTDAAIRWAAPGISSSISSAFTGDEFVIGDEGQPTVYRLRLDGNMTQGELPSSVYTDFNHNIDPGQPRLLGRSRRRERWSRERRVQRYRVPRYQSHPDSESLGSRSDTERLHVEPRR